MPLGHSQFPVLQLYFERSGHVFGWGLYLSLQVSLAFSFFAHHVAQRPSFWHCFLPGPVSEVSHSSLRGVSMVYIPHVSKLVALLEQYASYPEGQSGFPMSGYPHILPFQTWFFGHSQSLDLQDHCLPPEQEPGSVRLSRPDTAAMLGAAATLRAKMAVTMILVSCIVVRVLVCDRYLLLVFIIKKILLMLMLW